MATVVLFDSFIRDVLTSVIDLDSHSFKMVLSNTAPDAAANETLSDITEIAAGNGYSAGGLSITNLSVTETGAGTGIWQWSFSDPAFTAGGGSIGPFRYLVIYDDTPASKPLVGYLDYGTTKTVTSGNSFSIDIGASGVIRAQEAA